MANKTKPTTVSVSDFLKTVKKPARVKDAKTVMKMLSAITGKRAKMWGPSIIGYDRYEYRYESGREGDAIKIGLSPRSQNLAIYIMPGFDAYKADLKKLGKHKIGKSCLYINSLDDVDIKVLNRIMKSAYQEMNKRYG